MAYLRHPHNRSWLTLAVIAGTMWAIADSSTRGTMGEVRSTAASDFTGGPSNRAQVPVESRLETIDPRTVPAASPTVLGARRHPCTRHARPPAARLRIRIERVEHRPLRARFCPLGRVRFPGARRRLSSPHDPGFTQADRGVFRDGRRGRPQ